jgi:hypothetical protein
MPCKLCDTIKDREYEEIPWSETSDKPSGTGEIIRQLEMVSFLSGDEWLYKCPHCGQFYKTLCWNELFTGWIEFTEIKKITETEAKRYLEMYKRNDI